MIESALHLAIGNMTHNLYIKISPICTQCKGDTPIALSNYRLLGPRYPCGKLSEIEKIYKAGFCRLYALNAIGIVARSYGPSGLIMLADGWLWGRKRYSEFMTYLTGWCTLGSASIALDSIGLNGSMIRMDLLSL